MTVSEISRLLTDESRPGAPEPTLLPWLARRITLSGLPSATAFGAASIFAGQDRWPVIADAIAALVAEREHNLSRLTGMLDILPPVAGHLSARLRAAVDWSRVRPDAVGYAALADQIPAETLRIRISPSVWADLAGRPPWATIFAARVIPPPRGLPPLADLRSLWWLASYPARNAATETDQEAVYLLPFRSGSQAQWQTLEAIEAAVLDGRYWYAAALIARAVPYVSDQERMRDAIVRMPDPWSSHLTRLTDRPGTPWARDEDELAASHPAISELDELAADVDPTDLARKCLTVMKRIAKVHRLTRSWETGTGWEGDEAVAQIYRLTENHLRLLGPAPRPPARYLNIYVAAAGQEEPAPPLPLELNADYAMRCNIGPADYRSLVEQDTAEFPEDLLPAGPLNLHVVLFLDGRVAAIKLIELPRTGSSAWAEFPLPRVTESSILHGDIAVYYGVAIVLMYGLVLPFGGDGGDGGSGPEATLRYRLSRSLADLAKLEGRSMSVATGASGSTSALFVNDLTFAPTEFRYQAGEVEKGLYPVRTAFYDAHFSVRKIGPKKGEVTKYSASRDHPYGKSASDMDRDMRELARQGSQVYGYLFSKDDRARLARFLREEAAARSRAPVLQVVSVGEQPAPIPWSALYDLPLGSDVGDYEPCPSIAEFGPGGNIPEPPVRCPHEDSHRNGGRWKSNQLCPWGFWGLSTIIEHPPSARTRDLETQVRPVAGPPVILVGYDTQLDGKLRERHLRALRDQHGDGILKPFIVNRGEVKMSLGAENMDVVYLYCHVIDDPTQPDQRIPAIQFGEGRVTRQDIDNWIDTDWPDSHWSTRHPLVILNGCGSVQKGPDSLANLVDAFVSEAGASGVIGTETAIEQGLGGWAMELFLCALRNQPVGEALRSMRWQMFRGGNLIGLAYTPYCLAGLTLSP